MQIPKTLHVRLPAEHNAKAAGAVASTLDPTQWPRIAFDFGEKGLIFYEWAALRVTPTTDQVGEQ